MIEIAEKINSLDAMAKASDNLQGLKDKTGKNAGTIFDNITESEHSLVQYKLKRFLIALGVNFSGTFELKDVQKVCAGKEIIVDVKIEKGIIEDSITAKDLFDTRIMNCIMPRPSEVVKKFNELYNNNSQDATHYFYDLSIASNYIRKSRTDKNIGFKILFFVYQL